MRVIDLPTFLGIAVSFWLTWPMAGVSQSKDTKKKFWTYPMRPKVTPTPPERMDPATEVPTLLDVYSWVVTSKGATAPLVDFDAFGRQIKAGEIPKDTPVKLDTFRVQSAVNFYLITHQGKQAWLSGRYIKVGSPLTNQTP